MIYIISTIRIALWVLLRAHKSFVKWIMALGDICSHGIGVAGIPLGIFSIQDIFHIAKIPVRFYEPLLYLTGVPATDLRRRLSNMNVIFNSSCGRLTDPGRTVYHDDVIKWRHFPRYWPFVRGNHRSPVNSPHKGQWRGALVFSLICVWINGWVNNRGAGDLRRYRAHNDVIVMCNMRGNHIAASNLVAWCKSLFEMATTRQWSHFLVSAGRGCCRSMDVLFWLVSNKWAIHAC